MNTKWIFTIILIVTFCFTQGVCNGEDERTCPDVVVMFGNGVWNSDQDARLNKELLQIRFEAHISGTDLEGKISYDTSYNPSASELLGLLGFLDFAETYVQDIETNHSQFWRYLAGLDLMPDILQDRLKEISSFVDSAIVSINPSVQEHIDIYDGYLREGKTIVLVAHSQGNLYGNIAYLGLNPDYKDGFGIVSVANPDSYVASGGPHTTIDEDYIIWSLQLIYPDVLSANLDNFFGPVNLDDWSGHKFIDSYMASGHDAETVILDNVVDMINDLSLCIYDHFDDDVLDPAWQQTSSNADGWSYDESGTLLTVTDISSTVLNDNSGGTWARVFLSQPSPALDNFEAEFNFNWDSEGDVKAMQYLYFRINDENGGAIAYGGYADAWIAATGSKIGGAGGSSLSTGYNSLPLSGSAAIRITRENNYIRFYWDEQEMVSGPSYGNVGGVEIVFMYYAKDGWGGVSFFGSESVDLISLGPLPLP